MNYCADGSLKDIAMERRPTLEVEPRTVRATPRHPPFLRAPSPLPRGAAVISSTAVGVTGDRGFPGRFSALPAPSARLRRNPRSSSTLGQGRREHRNGSALSSPLPNRSRTAFADSGWFQTPRGIASRNELKQCRGGLDQSFNVQRRPAICRAQKRRAASIDLPVPSILATTAKQCSFLLNR